MGTSVLTESAGFARPESAEGAGWHHWLHATLTPSIIGASIRHERGGLDSAEILTDDKRIEPLMDGMLNNVGLARLDSGNTPAAEALFQQTDAFGSVLATSGTPGGPRAGLKELGSFAWRGREWTKSFGFLAGANSADAGASSENATDLYRMGDRAYDATVGRFRQADRLLLDGVHPPTANRYVYAAADPVNRTTPSAYTTYIEIIGVSGESAYIRAEHAHTAGGTSTPRQVKAVIGKGVRVIRQSREGYCILGSRDLCVRHVGETGNPNCILSHSMHASFKVCSVTNVLKQST